jgi:HEAT repeats
VNAFVGWALPTSLSVVGNAHPTGIRTHCYDLWSLRRRAMGVRRDFVVLLCLLACGGCGKTKSTDEMIQDLKSTEEKDRITAVRLLPQRHKDAAKVMPALIEALKDQEAEVRRSAAIGLGSFGEQAKDAIDALQTAQKDKDVRVRTAASVALTRIDPQRFP